MTRKWYQRQDRVRDQLFVSKVFLTWWWLGDASNWSACDIVRVFVNGGTSMWMKELLLEENHSGWTHTWGINYWETKCKSHIVWKSCGWTLYKWEDPYTHCLTILGEYTVSLSLVWVSLWSLDNFLTQYECFPSWWPIHGINHDDNKSLTWTFSLPLS